MPRSNLNVNLPTSPYTISPRPIVRSGIGYRSGSMISTSLPSSQKLKSNPKPKIEKTKTIKKTKTKKNKKK